MQRWRDAIVKIAKKKWLTSLRCEMSCALSEDRLSSTGKTCPSAPSFTRSRFSWAPLDEVRLARYVVAEMPASPHIDSDLLADVIARATGGGQAINRVGALYDLRLFAEEESLPDSVFRPDRVTGLQAAPSGFPADVGRGPLFVRTLDGRARRCQCWPTSPANGRAKATSPTHISSPFVALLTDPWVLGWLRTGPRNGWSFFFGHPRRGPSALPRGRGSSVERPQAKPRTNDVDAR